jgi:hypothetical protein
MLASTSLRRALERRGYRVERPDTSAYDESGLRSIHNHGFVDEPGFQQAYARGIQAAGEDYGWRWRCHIGFWAATVASRLPGDFVECGVNAGFLSSGIMRLLDWDRLGKTFWLLDTFAGTDLAILDAEEVEHIKYRDRHLVADGFYVDGVETVRANFSEWDNVRIVPGSVPSTLERVDATEVAFLHLDMNSSRPELEALEFFWSRLVPGAPVLMDDYAYRGYPHQYEAMNGFAARHGATIASLPTGQGLLLKPPPSP